MTQDTAPVEWDREVDVVVIGSGVAGMTAAIVAHNEGLEPLVIEKTGYFGGTAARSVGFMWFIDTKSMRDNGFEDSHEKARRYFAATVGDAAKAGLQEAYITKGSHALDYMLRHSELRVDAIHYPDYMPHLDGGMWGRGHWPREFDGRRLGANLARLRPPLPIFAPFGGLMMDEADMVAFLTFRRSLKAAWRVMRRLARYGIDRLRYPRGTRLLVGNALVASLYKTLIDRKVTMWTETTADGIVMADGRAVGVEVAHAGRLMRIGARRGVVIATGGYPGNAAMRQKTGMKPVDRYTIGLESNRGEGIAMAQAAGARLVDNVKDDAYFVPVSILTDGKRGETIWPHFMLDRAKPGAIAVDRNGNRFVDESCSYHAFVMGMYAANVDSAWLICDQNFLKRYGLGIIPAGWPSVVRFQKAGYLRSADTLEELARTIGVDPANLAHHVARNNAFASTGIDTDFGKGSTPYDLFKGDATHLPNPCLGPIAQAPFHAVQMFPGSFGTSRGLETDADARVLDSAGNAIQGLYACGNDMNSPVGGQYIGPGITLGPALTFGYIAAMHMAGRSS